MASYLAVEVNLPPPKATQHRANPLHSPDKPSETTVILGDSIIQNLQGYKLGKDVRHRVVVKWFSGATTSHMKYYVQPTLENSLERIYGKIMLAVSSTSASV